MPTMISLSEALARAMAEVTDRPIEFCRGSVEVTNRELAKEDPDKLRTYAQLVPVEVVAHIAAQLRQSTPRDVSPAESAHRRALAASYGLAQLLEEEGLDPLLQKPMSRVETRKMLYEQACSVYPLTYALSQDEEEVTEKAVKLAGDNVALQLLLDSDQSHHFYACGRWADQAFPIVQLAGHRYAAALMSTTIPATMEVHPPWKAFLIEVPDGLVSTEGPDGQLHDVTYVLVHVHGGYLGDAVDTPVTLWTFLAFAGAMTLHRYNQTFDRLVTGDFSGESDYAFDVPLGSRDERALQLLTRLVLSVCVTMSDPDRVKIIGKHRKGWTAGPGRAAKEPEFRTFRVGKPIQMDCRSELHAYLDGRRRGPVTVQFLVRGHFREQACGPKHSKHKTIWIEPHWKGQEDAPIMVRPHVVHPEEVSR